MFVSKGKTDTNYKTRQYSLLKKIQVTFTLSPEVLDEIRDLQTVLMMRSDKSWSFSKVVELVLEDGMKNYRTNKDINVSKKTVNNT